MRTALARSLTALLPLLFLVACSSDDGGTSSDTGIDTTADASMSDGGGADVGTADGGETADVSDVATMPDTAAEDAGDVSAPADTVDIEDTAADVAVDVAEDVAPDVVTPWPPLELEYCGSTPYEWLPPEQVGDVVAFRRLELLHTFSRQQLDALLEQAGYEVATPVSCGATIYRLRYVTQDRGELREATAAVGVPDCAEDDETIAMALWMHHSVGFVDKCAPSADTLFAAVAPALLASRGFLAVAPDLLGLIGFGDPSPEGVLHPYLIAEPTAIAGLDAVRATIHAVADDDTLPDGDPQRLVVAGGSQGAHAAFFVDRYAPYYAPEMNILAVAAIVPPTDLRAIATNAVQQWTPPARILPTFLATMRNWYGAPEDLSGLLTDTDPLHLATNIESIMAEDCRFELSIADVDGLTDMYEPDFLETAAADDWESLPPFDCYLDQNSVATSSVPYVSDTPVLAVFAENDELIPLDAERADIERLCEMGYEIQVTVCGGLRHTEGGQAAMGILLDWTQDRGEGIPPDMTDACTIPDPVDCRAQ